MTTLERLKDRLALIQRVALRLGAGPVAQLKLLFGGVWFLLRDAQKTSLGFSARLSKFDRQISFRFEDLADYLTLRGIFLEDEYLIGAPHAPDVILDLGSNTGLSLLYFRLRYPEARIYGFEPDPTNFRRLQRNIQPLERVEVHNVAIAGFNGSTTFYADPHRGQSSSIMRRRPRQQAVEVEAVTLDALLDRLDLQRVDLLKFDIEGAEMEVFRHVSDPERVQCYIGEVHPDLGEWDLDEFLHLFDGFEVDVHRITDRRYQMIARSEQAPASDHDEPVRRDRTPSEVTPFSSFI